MSLTVQDALVDHQRVNIRVVDGTIVSVGPDVVAEPGDEILDANGAAAVPGLVNAHTHAAMTLFRALGDDLPLMEWLQTRIWPAEARLTEDDVYWGTRLACIEMLRSGTVEFVDMYWHGPAVARAVADSGMRAVVASVFFDGGDPDKGRAARSQVLDDLDAIAETNPRVRAAVGPHALYTVSGASLDWLADVADERQIALHIHLSETEGEVHDCIEAHGVRPAEWLDRHGVLSPRSVLAHGNWLDDDELALVAERGATVATNPVSNCKLANGRIFDARRAAAAGVALGLGTDGSASNNSLDLLQDLKVFALLQKHDAGDPSAMTAEQALAVATGARSELLGARRVAPGAPGDFVLMAVDEPELTAGLGVDTLTADLVYAATGAQVRSVVVDGTVAMRDRVVPGTDEVLAEVRARLPRLRGT